jgi:hypothetical protein
MGGRQLLLEVIRYVGALEQILAQLSIGIFVGAGLPRAVRIGITDPDRDNGGCPTGLLRDQNILRNDGMKKGRNRGELPLHHFIDRSMFGPFGRIKCRKGSS